MILLNAVNRNQGMLLIPKLLGANMAVRACLRSEASAKPLKVAGVKEVLVGVFSDLTVMAYAVEGLEKVYGVCLTAHPLEREMGMGLLDASRAAGFGIERRQTAC